jgi:nitrite reductase/ring-hydroxylating ferredoxin subunit
VAIWDELADRTLAYALVGDVDLVVVRFDDDVSVFYGRCLHRGALLADGHVRGKDLICGVHNWDYRLDTGVSSYRNEGALPKFAAWVEDGAVLVDADEVDTWELKHPQPFDRDAYQGLYQDHSGTAAEPNTKLIHRLAADGLERVGHHGPVAAMGVPGPQLPGWDDIQFVTAQLARAPQLDDVEVGTKLVIGPQAQKPLELDIPIFVSDMSFGALSEEAKVSLARGAELVGTGICSGEGGMLPEEQQANSRYFYELASARFGFSLDKLANVQAFHFKDGQAAKTGTGGHLPGDKVKGRIAEVRGLPEGQSAISPARFPEWSDEDEFRHFTEQVKEATGGIPVGFKLSAEHIEDDIDAALRVGVDYVILDGRGGATGAAPTIFRDNISVPTIPALARARAHLDERGRSGEGTLIITGGLRTPAAGLCATIRGKRRSFACATSRARRASTGVATTRPRTDSRSPAAWFARRSREPRSRSSSIRAGPGRSSAARSR